MGIIVKYFVCLYVYIFIVINMCVYSNGWLFMCIYAYLCVFMCIYSNRWLFMLIFNKCVKLLVYIFTVCLKCAERLIKYLSPQ